MDHGPYDDSTTAPAQDASADVVRRWCSAARATLRAHREEIDSLNVYPVPDQDTGTNLYLTIDAAAAAVEALADNADAATTLQALSRGALLGARGNSGIILSQLLRGIGDVLGESASVRGPVDGALLCAALHRAAELAYAAVARPVEGTILSVAAAAAAAARASANASAGRPAGADLPTVARAAAAGAWAALGRTPAQLEVLRAAGVVDAGGRGLCELLDALVQVLGDRASSHSATDDTVATALPGCSEAPSAYLPDGANGAGRVFEVMYLLDASDAQVTTLRRDLDAMGESLVVVGGDGLWNVHVHVDDAGAAVEAGVKAGRPHRIRVTQLRPAQPTTAASGQAPPREGEAGRRGVVCVVAGPGLADLLAAAGAEVVAGGPRRRVLTAEVLAAIRRTGAREVVVLPNDADSLAAAQAAAGPAREDGLRVAVVPTRASVQAIAAMAVHEPHGRFDDDVVRMTAAAGHARHGGVTVADRDAVTMAGMCRAGDVLGIVDGDVVVIGADLAPTARTVVERLLTGGGELVTLLVGAEGDEDLAGSIAEHLRHTRPEVQTVILQGGQPRYPLLVGVE
jgi:DAK2 domain fusion protein YloV